MNRRWCIHLGRIRKLCLGKSEDVVDAGANSSVPGGQFPILSRASRITNDILHHIRKAQSLGADAEKLIGRLLCDDVVEAESCSNAPSSQHSPVYEIRSAWGAT